MTQYQNAVVFKLQLTNYISCYRGFAESANEARQTMRMQSVGM